MRGEYILIEEKIAGTCITDIGYWFIHIFL